MSSQSLYDSGRHRTEPVPARAAPKQTERSPPLQPSSAVPAATASNPGVVNSTGLDRTAWPSSRSYLLNSALCSQRCGWLACLGDRACSSRTGQTPAKQLLGHQVIDEHTLQPLGFARMFFMGLGRAEAVCRPPTCGTGDRLVADAFFRWTKQPFGKSFREPRRLQPVAISRRHSNIACSQNLIPRPLRVSRSKSTGESLDRVVTADPDDTGGRPNARTRPYRPPTLPTSTPAPRQRPNRGGSVFAQKKVIYRSRLD